MLTRTVSNLSPGQVQTRLDRSRPILVRLFVCQPKLVTQLSLPTSEPCPHLCSFAASVSYRCVSSVSFGRTRAIPKASERSRKSCAKRENLRTHLCHRRNRSPLSLNPPANDSFPESIV